MNINYEKASFKDFENIPGVGPYKWAAAFGNYLDYLNQNGHMNYRLETSSGCGPVVDMDLPDNPNKQFVSLVSNDYLGFTQHPKVKKAAIEGIVRYGTGAGASPAIGGFHSYHRELEEKIAKFYKRKAAIIYTTGYTANSASLQALLKKEDLAIVDMEVHASVYEGLQLTNVKMFLHNNLEVLERILKENKDKYRTMMVIIDGVYSQNGDIAHLKEIIALTKSYGGYVLMDDAHGTGVIGNTGRGVIELDGLYDQVDIITGTFSKALGHIGGYLVADPELVQFLKFQSRQHIFSSFSSPASTCILKAIDLIDDEPEWRIKLWDNIAYFKNGLKDIGLNIGNSASAIIPVKIGNIWKNGEVCRLLQQAGVYANQIMYPAVARKDARIRMSLMATHTKEHLDLALNAWSWVADKQKLREHPEMVE